MDGSAHIRLWMGNDVPEQYRNTIGLPEFDGSIDESSAPVVNGATIIFVAHVPFAVHENPVYKQGNWQQENCGWMREGECGLFGANALRVCPHPEKDGILIVGSAV